MPYMPDSVTLLYSMVVALYCLLELTREVLPRADYDASERRHV